MVREALLVYSARRKECRDLVRDARPIYCLPNPSVCPYNSLMGRVKLLEDVFAGCLGYYDPFTK